MITANILLIISLLISIIFNLYAIIIGKFFVGVFSGILNITSVKMIAETVPNHLLGAYGISSNLSINMGIFFSMFMGLVLPKDDNYDGMMKDEYWRLVFLFPGILAVI